MTVDQPQTAQPVQTLKYIFLSLTVICIGFYNQPVQAKRKNTARQAREQSGDAFRYAQEMIQEGRKRLKRKKYREAIPFFERSQRRVPDVKNLYTLGAIYKKLKNCPKALEYWTRAQADCDNCGLSMQIDQAILQHTKSCSTEISIQSLPRATVLLDGEMFGETPYAGHLLIGTHKLELRSQGHLPYVQRLQVNTNTAITLDVVLQPIGQSMGSSMGASKQGSPQALFGQPVKPSMPTAVQQAVPAEERFKAEEIAKQSSKQSKLQIAMASIGVVMGLSSLGLYAYSLYEYNRLVEIKQNNATKNLSLANQADQASSFQATSRFLAVLSGLSLGSLLLID